MKKEQVPQDDEGLLDGIREIQYAVDADGRYVQVQSVGWAPKNAALRQARELVSASAATVLAEVRAGRLSPLAYHMESAMMDASLLAGYSGVPKRHVRRHMSPDGFREATPAALAAYARALGLTVEQLSALP
jgi:hypothetical protein